MESTQLQNMFIDNALSYLDTTFTCPTSTTTITPIRDPRLNKFRGKRVCRKLNFDDTRIHPTQQPGYSSTHGLSPLSILQYHGTHPSTHYQQFHTHSSRADSTGQASRQPTPEQHQESNPDSMKLLDKARPCPCHLSAVPFPTAGRSAHQANMDLRKSLAHDLSIGNDRPAFSSSPPAADFPRTRRAHVLLSRITQPRLHQPTPYYRLRPEYPRMAPVPL